jgi:hypothetical protein
MAISNPVLVGSAFQRNQAANTPFSFNPVVAVPAGALLVYEFGGTITNPDTAVCSLIDSKSNVYEGLVDLSGPTGSPMLVSLFICKSAIALTTADTVTFQCSERVDLGGVLYYYTGAQGSFTNSLVKWSSEWSATPLNPNGTMHVNVGDSVHAGLVVAGPNNDVFTQSSGGWATDITQSATGFNATVHCTAKHDNAAGDVVYSPTLNANRLGVMILLGFK